MRYVQKLDTPRFFIRWTKGLGIWNDCKISKEPLRRYILKHEQNNLCIYCESKITSMKSSSHIEHIQPKHLDIPNLTFDYKNIAVSCNGNGENISGDKTNYNCGHRKDKNDTPYNDELFLNPVIEKDIRDYFKYDFDDCLICTSDKDIEKAQYMIDTLHLNDGGLLKAREKALKNFINEMKKITNIKIRKEKMKEVLNREDIAFISFLRFKYKNFLEE